MNVTPSTSALPAGAASAPVVAGAAQAMDEPLAAPVQTDAASFAQWLAQALPAELLAEPVVTDEQDTAGDAAAVHADAAPDTAPDASAPDAAVVQDPAPAAALLGAMAAPLLAPTAPPLAPAAAASAAPSGTADLAVSASGSAGDSPLRAPAARNQAPAGASVAAAALLQAAAPAIAPRPQAGARGDPAAEQFSDAPVAAAPAMPAAAPAPAQGGSTTAAPTGASQAPLQAGPAAADAAKETPAAAAPVAPAWAAAPAPAQGLAQPAAAMALEGPPAAWRQTLHEALGERLRTQVGNNLEQAVIRLDPPNLGRIEIAIRHSAGTLEVSLSATHNDVVRQLQAVSDNLRNDLASRQYSEVSVTVVQAPRAAQPGGAGPFADQQGRPRQGAREQEQAAPGMALADAGTPGTTFSLNGRD
jgi:flagellar hook-length control protein FliK